MPNATGIVSGYQLSKGAKVDKSTTSLNPLQQPIQFLPYEEKDEKWSATCMDYIEYRGLRQLRVNSPRLLKYYQAAKGIIDRSDYIPEEDNDNLDMINILSQNSEPLMELRNFPLIPPIIDSFRTEFTRRSNKLFFTTIDETSLSEKEQEKTSKLEDILLQDALFKQSMKLQMSGADMNSEETQKQLAPDVLKQLPELQDFYSTSYRNIYAEWAQHQMKADEYRFHMRELEETAFTDSIITDRPLFHFEMKENDYNMEVWTPLLTAYHKSPSTRWMSDAFWVMNTDFLSPADVIDKYGWMMTAEQMESLEKLFPIRNVAYLMDMPNDGNYYDTSKSYEENSQMPSLGMRQFMSRYELSTTNGDIVGDILRATEDLKDEGLYYRIRVTRTYWKSQRKIYQLTKIDENGVLTSDIVSEEYKVTDKPLYDTTFYKQKTKNNLIFGEHLDTIWINEVWGGIKIGPNRPTWYGMNNPSSVQPLYIGINGGKPGRLPFQFKGDDDLWGCKLPVEGAVFSDRNTISVPMIARLLPYQIGFNMVNNQIMDTLVDEQGTVLILDQNALPKSSMGQDWSENPIQKAYIAMKDFKMLPLDHSMANLGATGTGFNQHTVLDLSQTNYLMNRINVANAFRNEAYRCIGFNEQRMGGQPGGDVTATQVRQSTEASYDQTEMYYVQFCDYLMPRVHQMRTDLAQYYNSTNPSVTLQYLDDNNIQQVFRMDGTKLLTRHIAVYPATRTNGRQILQRLQDMVLTNNTTQSTIYELGTIMQADNLPELNHVLKKIEARNQANIEADRNAQAQQHQAELEQEQQLKMQEWDRADRQAELERQKDILVAEIQAASRAATARPPQEGEDAYQEGLDRIQEQSNFREQMDFQKEQALTKNNLEKEKLNVQRNKINAEERRTTQMMQEKRISDAQKAKEKAKSKK